MKKGQIIFLYILLIIITVLALTEITYFYDKNEKSRVSNIAKTLSYTYVEPKAEKMVPKPIIFDGLTKEELIEKLNKNLYDDLAGTGEYFANYTEQTGLDPYLAISIINLETG